MSAHSESLQVFVRVRPPIYKEVKLNNAITVNGNQSLTLADEKRETRCSYDCVFGETTQQVEVFEKVKPLLNDVLTGVNSCIFAYGQTSAGKSFTMIGPNGGQDIFRRSIDEWGILPRASEFLLGYLNEKSVEGVLSYEVKASFLQIYNENLYDLLRDTGPMFEEKPGSAKETELRIREIPKPKSKSRDPTVMPEVFISGLSEYRVQTSEDILRILAVGANNRMTRSTDFNLTSSRSHALLQLTFEIETQSDSGQTVINRSKLNLVDLAGSEKIPYVNSEANNAKHMKELTSINKSLSSLGNVIAALSSNNRNHIPYRDSKLTRILQDSLSGNTRTILIACVAPTEMHTSESLSTLQFADRAKNVMLSVKPNTLVDDKFLLNKAHAEITRLKALLGQALKQIEAKNKLTGGLLDGGGGGGVNPEVREKMKKLEAENESLRKDNLSLRSQKPTVAPLQMSTSMPPAMMSTNINSSVGGAVGASAAAGGGLLFPFGNPAGMAASTNNVTGNNSFQSPMGMLSPLSIAAAAAAMHHHQGGTGTGGKKKGGVGGAAAKSWDVGRFSTDYEVGGGKKKKGKAAATKHIPPLFDLMESNHSSGHTKKVSPSKLHSQHYKAVNDKQINELNAMLSASAMQANMQQQQNMMQYLQQQQFMQQNFPQLQPLQQQPQGTVGPAGMLMNPTTILAGGLTSMQPNSYNTAMVGGAGMQQNGTMSVAAGAAAIDGSVSIATNVAAQDGNSNNDSSPATQENASGAVGETAAEAVPAAHIASASTSGADHHGGGVEGGGGGGGGSEDINNMTGNQYQQALSTGRRSALSSAATQQGLDTSRLGSGGVIMPSNRIVRKHPGSQTKHHHHKPPPPSDLEEFEVEEDGETVPMQQQQQQQQQPFDMSNGSNTGGKAFSKLSTNSSVNILASGVTGSAGGNTHAFMASLMNKSATGAAGMLGAGATGPVTNMDAPPLQRAAKLTHSQSDVGVSVQLFSFRMNTWDRVDIVDYDSVKRLHKCRHPDGNAQWLDLAKKPIRALPEDDIQ
mmetsp:Transcript_13391/g.22322  ORF Transcript_13391/g.22322 Transcript_13391/m.22322 type:complete len:1029 (+) Transcript_13391:37-3123(+)